MARTRKKHAKGEPRQSDGLKGWDAIARYLGQPIGTVKRWADEGMPAERRGRYVVAQPDRLNEWLGRESGVQGPVHIAPGGDLRDDLREALHQARERRA